MIIEMLGGMSSAIPAALMMSAMENESSYPSRSR